MLYNAPACEHQTVVGVELGKLAFTDFHTQRHSLPQRFAEVGPDKGEHILPAHAGGALKGYEAEGAVGKGQLDTFWPKKPFCQLLQFLHAANSAAVKDTGEVQIDKHLLKRVRDLAQRRLATDFHQGQKLTEQGTVVLLCSCDHTLVCLIICAENKAVAILCFLRAVHDRPRGDLEDAVFL